jgi:hypothetical protein
VLARVASVLHSQAERVNFALDAKAPRADQVEAALQAMSEGEVAPNVRKQIVERSVRSVPSALPTSLQLVKRLEGRKQ